MYSFTIAGTGTSQDAWRWLQACAAVDDAIAAMNAAGARLIGLTADTQWAADGVRMLNSRLVQLQTEAGLEASRLSSRAWELDRGAL
ncbi:hypothetical protein [Microbacterium sp.]|uniref:hypothetical protein n=1 Tax=Microbacterium sp. TaxID=51671 RepID=UPI0039E707B5